MTRLCSFVLATRAPIRIAPKRAQSHFSVMPTSPGIPFGKSTISAFSL
jgi:hypothetical protein